MNKQNAEVKNEKVTIEEVEYRVPEKITRFIMYNRYANVHDEKLETVNARAHSKRVGGLQQIYPFGVVYEDSFEEISDQKAFLFPITLKVSERIDIFKVGFDLINYMDEDNYIIKYVKPAIITTDNYGEIKVVKRGAIYFE